MYLLFLIKLYGRENIGGKMANINSSSPKKNVELVCPQISSWPLIRDIGAFLVFLITLIIYSKTAQPTVSFWDCGEFISCSYLLAVPHPPGAPLFLLLGRLFSLLPLGVEIAHKINWMSSLFNALTIGMIFLILARVLNRWFGHVKNWTEVFIAIVGAGAGALLAGLGTTFWNNAVEAEVYGLAMFITAIVVYLAILWSEQHKDPRSDRFIILTAFLLYLGIGAHMTTLIMLPPLFLFYIIMDKAKRKNPVFWLTWFILFLVATEFNMFVESFMCALVIFALAAVMTNNSNGKTVFLVISAFWGIIQLILITKGTTIPGILFKEYGLSGETPSTLTAIAQLIIIAGAFFIVLTKNYIVEWRKGFITILLATIAFGMHSYTIIRSRANPYIDENDPETIEEFRDYMDRKQYGQSSLWVVMLTRKGAWSSQFGTHMRMGFWGFFRDQWSDPKQIPRKFTLNGWLFFILAYLGVAYAAYRNPKWGILLFMVTLISTIGLLVYLNFSDGTRTIHMEVRDRDYFYTPGFMFMGALMGLGFAAILSFIYRGFREIVSFLNNIGPFMFFIIAFASLIIMGLVRQDIPYFLGTAIGSFIAGILCTFIRLSKQTEQGTEINLNAIKNIVIVILGLIFLITPSISPATYWFENDRSRNYIPYDYAFNILDSVDKDGIIFTNGDNDTFPLWFLQAVPKVRTDVKIVNLSLLNTQWYIKQIKRDGVPIKLNEQQIDRLRAYRDPATGEIIRVQDLMVEHIINSTPIKTRTDSDTTEPSYYLDPPVFFAVTVAPDNKVGYDPYLVMEGLVYRVTTDKESPKVDIERMKYNLFERYQYRGLKDSTIYKDENSKKLLQNYTTGFITLAYEYRKKNDTTGVMETLEKMGEVIPFDWRANSFAGEFYSWLGMWDKVDSLFADAKPRIANRIEKDPDEARLFQMFFEIYYRSGKIQQAREAMKAGLETFPDDRQLFQAYIGFLYKIRDKEALVKNLEIWTTKHPDDKQYVDFYNQVRQGALEQMWKPRVEETLPATTDIKPKTSSPAQSDVIIR
ncbi:hypothetical protein DRQ33_04745 [bacterium]|nr:MAG: hypothetical protein DRQ33_04745 [bacterium]